MVRVKSLIAFSPVITSSNAFVPSTFSAESRTSTSLFSSNDAKITQSRRDIFKKIALVTTSSATTILSSLVANADSTKKPTKEELQRIKAGKEGIDYLLANWEKVTTTCRDNGGECKRDAEPVRRYMGLRSTTDPLFQIEKVFAKVKNMDDIDFDRLEEYFNATEEFNSAISMSNSMAFISQFGEYNPSGGKEEVLKYLTESEKQVKLALKSLNTIIGILDL
eukprot:CAMPEP_0194280464 /NCGR_PEP_ID=MMETSP0169-20130528/17424_1 /TAXON_ID=218684 /ORGANISM="Corethron pennatum, Strain L29A3" /LENGTH=221 /DNA_ID=CAMNT_0039025187 /DNA_START=174 /DNA_END=839 /DNA_ORIENTATION=-